MTRTQPAPAAATAPNRPGNLWRRDRMQAACLIGCVTAHSLGKHINLAASVTHRRLQMSKLCRCLAPKWEPNARLCAAETRRRDGRGRRRKTACSCHWLLWNAHRSKGRAANNDVSAGRSRRRCNCLRWLLLMAMLSGCSNHPIFAGGHEAATLSCHVTEGCGPGSLGGRVRDAAGGRSCADVTNSVFVYCLISVHTFLGGPLITVVLSKFIRISLTITLRRDAFRG